jgi:hypothetical protein
MSSHRIGPMLGDAAWDARITRVLKGALRLWGVDATVERAGSGLELTQAAAAFQDLTPLLIVPRAPHGWLIVRGTETLGTHAGLPGLLRQLREELAPQAPRGRLIIGTQPLR